MGPYMKWGMHEDNKEPLFTKPQKWKLVSLLIFLVVLGIICGIAWICDHNDPKSQEVYIPERVVFGTVNDTPMPEGEWVDLGYTSVVAYHEDLAEMRNSVNDAEADIQKFSGVISEDEIETLRYLQDRMADAVTMGIYNEALEEYNALIDELTGRIQAAAVQQPKYTPQASNGYISNGSDLTRSGGVNYYNGRRETWYSQKVLPGGGLDIPGRHVASDGTIRDADGYIVVASGDHAKGEVVDTSLGAGKVYDYCGTPGTTDIYTNW